MELEFNMERRDRYGLLLAYVYLTDGRMLNEEIVKEGYANILTIPPNVKYQESFLRAYREARHNEMVFWK